MANKANEGTTRRGFMAAAIGAAAATAIPTIPSAAPAAPTSLAAAVAAWPKANAALVERFRPAYLAEVVRFAEELRPRFAVGELHGYRSECDERHEDEPLIELGRLCGERFGFKVERVKTGPEPWQYEEVGDEEAARFVMAVSPSADAAGADEEWNHAGYAAQEGAAFDVIAIARARGYYTPTPDEGPDLEQSAWAREVLS